MRAYITRSFTYQMVRSRARRKGPGFKTEGREGWVVNFQYRHVACRAKRTREHSPARRRE